MYDRMADDAYRRQVVAELHEKVSLRGSHGEETNELTRKLLGLARTVNYSSHISEIMAQAR